MRKFVINYWKTILCSLCILALSMAPFSGNRFETIPYTDKLVHAIMYAILTFILLYDYSKYRTVKTIRHYKTLIILPILYGGLMEIMQGLLTTTRSADMFDFLANSIGVFIGLIISYTFYYARR